MKMSHMTAATFLVIAVSAVTMSEPAVATEGQQGIYALPEGQAKVSATIVVSPDRGLRRTLDIAMTPLGGTAPVTRYEAELSKQLHVIAISDDLRDFVHEHSDGPERDGHFRVPFTFPHKGKWYVYADGVPGGLGQQVMRFDLAIDVPKSGARLALPQPTGTRASDGRYSVRFDAFSLKAGQESDLALHLLRDGKPAPDVTPFLGVAAHAVFIDASDLTYVHVHAAPTKAPAVGTGMQPMPGMPATAPASEDVAGMEGMGAPLPVGFKVPSDLTMHVKAPKSGSYVLWLQFNGGEKVRTMRFVVPVK